MYEVLFEPYRYIQSLMQLWKGFYPIFRGLAYYISFDYSTLASPAHDTHTRICFVFLFVRVIVFKSKSYKHTFHSLKCKEPAYNKTFSCSFFPGKTFQHLVPQEKGEQ